MINLVKNIKALDKGFGGYIEYFYDEKDAVIVKFSNGVLTVAEHNFEKLCLAKVDFSNEEIKLLTDSFLKSGFI